MVKLTLLCLAGGAWVGAVFLLADSTRLPPIPAPPNCETTPAPEAYTSYPIWKDSQWACLFIPKKAQHRIFFATPPRKEDQK